MTPEELIVELDKGNEWPFHEHTARRAWTPKVHRTERGTSYFQLPGVSLLAQPEVNRGALNHFLTTFDESHGFDDYCLWKDYPLLDDATTLCKAAGQLCYLSLGPKRTKNVDAAKYFNNIFSSGHGSIAEHANFSFLFFGTSRSLSHELVRHRHASYSQVSQRYVDGSLLRFVERPEYVQDNVLHQAFLQRIDRYAADYQAIAEWLLDGQQAGSELLSAERKTDARKKVNQAARSLLPNETEAPIIVTANVRAWRHFLEMRASQYAEVEIRALAIRVYLILVSVAPILFQDYRIVTLPDGTYAVETDYRKV